MININNQRRGRFFPCHYWLTDDIRNANELINKKEPNGLFYARPITTKQTTGNPIQNVFLVENNTITIETTDIVNDLKHNCLVKFNNEIWFVESVSRVLGTKQNQFQKNFITTTTILLRR